MTTKIRMFSVSKSLQAFYTYPNSCQWNFFFPFNVAPLCLPERVVKTVVLKLLMRLCI